MDIETLATSAVKDSIAKTDLLSPYINEKDKEPSWDGNIYLYKSADKSKSNLKGRVPVQIKGCSTVDLAHDRIKFSVDCKDLENYLQDGGVIYFVVGVSEDGEQKKIYYAPLLPVNLQEILEDCKESKTLEFSEFPTDNKEKINLFFGFFDDKQKQASFVNSPILSLEDYEKNIKEITFSQYTSHPERINPVKVFFDPRINWYVNLKDISIPHPIRRFPGDLYLSQQISSEITVGSRLFYKHYERIHSKEDTTISIGKSVKIVIPDKSPQKMTIRLLSTSILEDACMDLDFFLSALSSQQFEIGKDVFPLVLTDKQLTNLDIEANKERLFRLGRLYDLFKMLGLNTGIDLAKLSEDHWNHIIILLKALVDEEIVTNLKEDLPYLNIPDIGEEKVLLCFHKTDTPDAYLITDFFKTPLRLEVELDGERLPVPQYSLLTSENYLELANLNCSKLLPAFLEIEGNRALYERANQTLLNLLEAYDRSGYTRTDILNAAKEFANWLHGLSEDISLLPREITELNLLQVYKRERALSEKEKETLWQMIETPDQRQDIRVGACLLLENQEAAKRYFVGLTPDEQENFKKYPIYRFWKKDGED